MSTFPNVPGGPLIRSMSDVRLLARQFVHNYGITPTPPEATGHVWRRGNPVVARLLSHQQWDSEVATALYCEVHERSRMREALGAAAQESNTYEGGLCMGFLDPEPDCSVGSPLFRRGFRDGQAYALKYRPGWETTFRYACMITVGGSGHYLATKQHLVTPEVAAWIDGTKSPVMMIAAASMLYGFATMYSSRLFGRDAFLSGRLLTRGPFHLHRNPYYASMGFGTTLLSVWMSAVEFLSLNPSTGAVAGFLTSLAGFFFTYHRNVQRDERVLEKQFGADYLAYKDKTPRYLPAVWTALSSAWQRAWKR